MYSGLTPGWSPVEWDLIHIDIDDNFDAGETMLEITSYKGNTFKKGERYRIFIEVDTAFAGGLVETNTWYEHPFEIAFYTETEIVIDWEPHSDNCILKLINKTEDLVITLDWDWTLHQKQHLLDNPIDALYYIRQSQNWNELDENQEPIRHINIDPGTYGSFFHSSLGDLRAVKICREILNYDDATTRAISKSICEEFNLVLYTDNNGNESVKLIDYPEPEISFTITVHDIIKEPEIIERDPNKIYCEPVVKFATDWSTNNPTKQFSIIKTDQDEYDLSCTPGLTAEQGGPLWAMAKTLRQAVNKITAFEFNFKWIKHIEDAIQLLSRKFVWMSKKRMKLVVSYEKAVNQTVGCWGKVVIPISTVGKEIRFIIEEMVSSKKRGKNSSLVSMQVVLWDNVTSEELEILQNQMYVILDQQLQGQVADEADLMQDLTQDHL